MFARVYAVLFALLIEKSRVVNLLREDTAYN